MKIQVYTATSTAAAYQAIEEMTPDVNWKGIGSRGSSVGDRWLQNARTAVGDEDAVCMIGHSHEGLLRAAIAEDGRYAIVWPRSPRSTPPPEGHTRLTINLRDEDHQALKTKAAKEKKTIRGLIEDAIRAIIVE